MYTFRIPWIEYFLQEHLQVCFSPRSIDERLCAKPAVYIAQTDGYLFLSIGYVDCTSQTFYLTI